VGSLRGARSKSVLLVAFLGSTVAAHAACNGPQALVAKQHAHPTTENAVALGSWFATRKQFDCAVETFRSALKTNPNSAQLHFLEGLALLGNGHPAEALPAIQESARLDPQVIKPHLLLGLLYDQSGHHTEAEEQWKQALAIDPKSEPALDGLSAELLARQDYIGVITLLKDAPRTEKLTINLSKALGLLDYLDEASRVLTEALKESPKSVPLASALTVVLVKQRQYQDAINLLQQTVQQNPGNQEAEVQLFRVLVLTNHITLARPIGPKLLAQRPHDPELLYLNGIIDRSVGDYALAKTRLEESVARDPNFPNSRYDLGLVLVYLHEWQEGKQQLEKALELGAIEPQVHFELSKALHGLGENDRATAEIEQYQDLRKAEEQNLEAVLSSSQAGAALAAGKVDEAIGHYREAIAGDPKNAIYRYQLSIALNQAGDVQGEKAQLEEAVKLNPKLPGAQNALGYLLSRGGDADGATEHFRMAVQAAPAWVQAWINLAASLAVQAHFDQAREAAATALRLDPENPQARKLSDRLAQEPAAQQAQP
jgi:tetratricopeptide (TPR) repeat protein